MAMLSISPPRQCNIGDYPSIAVHPTKNIAICAYEGTLTNNKYFRVGIVHQDRIDWQNEIEQGKGEYARVGFFDKNNKVYVVLIYKRNVWRGCCYKIGELLPDYTINFGNSRVFCKDMRPSLAVRQDGTVVVIAEKVVSRTLTCHVGKVNEMATEINFNQSMDLFSGTTPSVAINDKHIILFYRIYGTDQLKYSCGCLGNKVEWKVRSQDFCKGIRPNVTLNNNGVVVTIHMSFMGRLLYFSHGTMSDEGRFTISSESHALGMGMHPAICLSNDNKLIEIHRSNATTHLWASQGLLSSASYQPSQPSEETKTICLAGHQLSYKVYGHMTWEYRNTQNAIELSFGFIKLKRKEKLGSLSTSGHYPMNRSPHGIALIINNIEFNGREGDRIDGADSNEQNLITVFQYLGYCVHVFNNLTADQMTGVMEYMGKDLNHTEYDSFVCCILSSGGKTTEYVCGSDNEEVVVSGTLSSMLSADNCPTLADKPKLFFVQACQSINKARPAPLLTSQRIEASPDPPIQKQDGPGPRPATSTSDLFFAYSYAISPSYVAYRNTNEGSCFITELCRALLMHATDSSLTDIVTLANDKLNSSHIQTCESTLKQKVFFF